MNENIFSKLQRHTDIVDLGCMSQCCTVWWTTPETLSELFPDVCIKACKVDHLGRIIVGFMEYMVIFMSSPKGEILECADDESGSLFDFLNAMLHRFKKNRGSLVQHTEYLYVVPQFRRKGLSRVMREETINILETKFGLPVEYSGLHPQPFVVENLRLAGKDDFESDSESEITVVYDVTLLNAEKDAEYSRKFDALRSVYSDMVWTKDLDGYPMCYKFQAH